MNPPPLSPRRRTLTTLAALLAAALAAPLPPAAAQTEDDAFTLFARFATVPELALEFTQTSHSKDGTVLATTTGRLAYRRPNQFRLQYATPDNPLIVSDGTTVWLYEQELDQAIAQPLATAQQNDLLQALATGDLNALAKNYILTAGLANDLRWLNANAASQEASLNRIALGFDPATGDLGKIELTDHFDGSIKLTITGQTPRTRPGDFLFTPPPGTDVIENE